MTKPLLRSIFAMACLIGSTAACCNDLSGTWTLSIENPAHRVVTTLRIKFTGERARSCMGGEWKVVKVVSKTTQDKDFFPISDPLSYHVEEGQLTIGRNEICDAYLLLQAPLSGKSVQGEYFSLGLGGENPLGHFRLELDQAK
jgi:hypothetical protein